MKRELKMHIANAEEEKTFEALKKAGADLSKIEARYNKWALFCDNLVAEGKQFTPEEYDLYNKGKQRDTKALLEMIDTFIK